MPRQETLHQIHRAAMFHHHALWRAGGTRGIDQIRRIARADDNLRRGIGFHNSVGMQHRDSGRQPGRQRRRAFAQQGRHQQRSGTGVLQQELQAFVGIGGIQRQVGRAGKQHTEHRDHRIRGTVAQHSDICVRSDALRTQDLRDAVGATQRLRIGPFATRLDQRSRSRRARGLKREQTVQGVGFRSQRRPAVAQRSHGRPLFIVQQRYPRQGLIRIRRGAAQQRHEVFGHPCDRRRREQLRAVVDQSMQTVGTVGKRERQFETRSVRIRLDVLGEQTVHAHAGAGRTLENEHRLEQRRPPRHALQAELFDHVFQRGLGVLQRVQHVRFRPRERLAERRVLAEIGAYRDGVDEQTDERFFLQRPAVGNRCADDDIAVAGPSRQQRLERAQHQHELGRALAARQFRSGAAQPVRESPDVACAFGRSDRRARPVGRQIQQTSRAGQRVLPIT